MGGLTRKVVVATGLVTMIVAAAGLLSIAVITALRNRLAFRIVKRVALTSLGHPAIAVRECVGHRMPLACRRPWLLFLVALPHLKHVLD